MRYAWHDTPIGTLLLAGDDDALSLIGFPRERDRRRPADGWVRDDSAFRDVVAQLDAYFAGDLRHFELRLAARGTAFQLLVWDALARIPWGETTTYSELAAAIGRPGAQRAVGAANGANPIPIVVPCHRVIGRDGSLTGFGGGIETKRWLLAHEGARPASRQSSLF